MAKHNNTNLSACFNVISIINELEIFYSNIANDNKLTVIQQSRSSFSYLSTAVCQTTWHVPQVNGHRRHQIHHPTAAVTDEWTAAANHLLSMYRCSISTSPNRTGTTSNTASAIQPVTISFSIRRQFYVKTHTQKFYAQDSSITIQEWAASRTDAC